MGEIPNSCKCLWIQAGRELAGVQLLFLGSIVVGFLQGGTVMSAGIRFAAASNIGVLLGVLSALPLGTASLREGKTVGFSSSQPCCGKADLVGVKGREFVVLSVAFPRAFPCRPVARTAFRLLLVCPEAARPPLAQCHGWDYSCSVCSPPSGTRTSSQLVPVAQLTTALRSK